MLDEPITESPADSDESQPSLPPATPDEDLEPSEPSIETADEPVTSVEPSEPAEEIPVPAPAPAQATQHDLERVREIIMGAPDRLRQPVREAEAEHLRDVLFGPKMEEYERRFSDLRREFDRVLNDQQQLHAVMKEFREAQNERLEAVERDMRQSQEELQRDLERVGSQAPVLQQAVAIVRQLQLLNNHLSQELGDVRASLVRGDQELRTLRSSVGQYRDQGERSVDALKRENRGAQDELKAELRRVADRLDDQKTDRKVLAAILAEIASRLETGYNILGIAGDLTSSAVE